MIGKRVSEGEARNERGGALKPGLRYGRAFLFERLDDREVQSYDYAVFIVRQSE